MPALPTSTHRAVPDGSDALTVGSFTPSVLLDLAGVTGTLADAGLDVTEVPVTSSPGQFRSLLGGEVDVALTSPDNVLAYRYNPGNPLGQLVDARIVAAVDRGMGLGLYGRPGLTPEGLSGARVAVDVPVSGFALVLYALADSLGVRRDDYELLTQGSTPQRLQALLAGHSDATMLNAGNELVAEAAGCLRLAGVEDLATPYLGTVVAVVGLDRLELATRLAGCLLRTAAAVMAGELDDAAVGSAARQLHLGPALAARYVERMRDPVHGLVPDGSVDEASLRTLVDLRRRYRPAPAPDQGTGEAGVLLDVAFGDPELVHSATGR